MPAEPTIPDLLAELRWRGLIHQCTNEPGLREHLAQPRAHPRRIYAGFDPTADSLTIGNLVPIMMMVHVRRAGHEPIILMGGGTGLVGDPSGKSAERQLMTEERVRANVESQRPIFERVFAHADGMEGRAAEPPAIVNNLDWLGKLGFLEALRDIGKHFSVNQMIQRDAVRDRLNNRDQGISYTEFSYALLQAYDFAFLHRRLGVSAQFGGSDQWGNIVAGLDLIHKESAAGAVGDGPATSRAFGLTAPLVTKADGGKFGKSERGAVWLSGLDSGRGSGSAASWGPGTGPAGGAGVQAAATDRTSAYAFHQFWLNAADADLERFLKFFTILPERQIHEILTGHWRDPGARAAQRVLADHATDLVHGPAERHAAEAAAKALFSGDISRLSPADLAAVFAEAPASDHPLSLLAGEGLAAHDLVALTSLVKDGSKSEAKQLLREGGVTMNGRKLTPADRLRPSDLLHGSVAALRRGKKAWHVTRWA